VWLSGTLYPQICVALLCGIDHLSNFKISFKNWFSSIALFFSFVMVSLCCSITYFVFLNQVRAWFTKIISGKVCVCTYRVFQVSGKN